MSHGGGASGAPSAISTIEKPARLRLMTKSIAAYARATAATMCCCADGFRGRRMTEAQAIEIVRNFKAYPKETISEAALLILDNESAYLPEDIAEARAAIESTIEGGTVVVSEEEIRALATRVVRAFFESNTSAAALAWLIDDLADDISNAIVDWCTKPHPLAPQ